LSDRKVPEVRQRTVILAGAAGSVLEWFDFGVFAYFAASIGREFFPSDDAFAQLLFGFSVFAVAYMMRPVGGVVLGWAGDRFGRKTMLRWSILMMGLASFSIGLLPTYATIGITASVLLVLLRMVQGLSVGGEYTGSMTLTTELASKGRRGLVSASATAGVGLGLLAASFAAWLVRTTLGPEQLDAWGWRLPFLAGIFIMLGGSWIRRHIPHYDAAHEDAGPPPEEHVLVHAFKRHWRVMLKIILIVGAPNAAFYLTNIWLVDLLQQHSAAGASIQGIETIAMSVAVVSPLIGGWISDHIGRKRTLIILTVLLGTLSWPLLGLAYRPEPGLVLLALCSFAFLETAALGVHGALLVEMTPVHARSSVFGIGYNFAMALFGGLIPIFAMLISDKTVGLSWSAPESIESMYLGSISVVWAKGYEPMDVVWIPIVLSVLALCVLIPMRETKDLRIDA
jgi:MHS family proline/betaine transporter-like MFS transporter